MDESKRKELQDIFKAFDEASIANQKYFLGFAEGYVKGLENKR